MLPLLAVAACELPQSHRIEGRVYHAEVCQAVFPLIVVIDAMPEFQYWNSVTLGLHVALLSAGAQRKASFLLQDAIWYAYFAPYPYERHEELIAEVIPQTSSCTSSLCYVCGALGCINNVRDHPHCER